MKQLFRLSVFACLLLSGRFQAVAQVSLLCGVDDRQLPDSIIRLMAQLPQLRANQHARQTAGARNTCRVAVEIDSDTYLTFEKDTNRIRSYVINRIENVSKIYEREINTQLVVVAIHIWKDTEPDPYRGEGNAFTLYSRFYTVWDKQFKDIPYDKRIYLFTKMVTLAGGVGGGVQALSSMDPLVIAHEFGHCFDSPHTQNCSWPGGPIDYCSPIEGGSCYSASLQFGTGTIMSYCIPRRLLTFHPLCQTLMQNHAVRNLSMLAKPDKAPVLPAQLTFSGTPFLYWNGQPQAERYDIELADDGNFTQSVVSDTTAVNGYDLSRLKPDQLYYARVRVVNALGRSDWSGVCQLQRGTGAGPASPVLLSPAADQRMVPFNNGVRTFTVQPVAGASAYECWVTYASDDSFQYPTKLMASGPVITAPLYSSGTLLWRVRAIAGGKVGAWSAVGRFQVTTSRSINLPFANRTATPLTFPFSFSPQLNTTTTQVSLATDSSFTKPVYSHTFLPGSTAYNTGLLTGLLPNTQYYIRLEETNTQDPAQLLGLLFRSVETFRTGSTALSANWSFVNTETHPTLPPGYLANTVVPTEEALWFLTDRGLTRLSQDSLTLRYYDRDATNGKLGNMSISLGTDDNRTLWVTNRVSNGDYATQYLQAGRYNPQTGDLTEQMVLSGDFVTMQHITGNPRLLYTSAAVYEPKGTGMAVLYQPPSGWSINRTFALPGWLWLIQLNTTGSGAPNQLVRINTVTRTSQVFSADNTPQLLKSLYQLAVDGFGNLWVWQASTTSGYAPLARFDGATWTSYNRSILPFSYPSALVNDPSGRLYVISSDTSPYTVYRFDGLTWKKMGDLALPYGGNVTADSRGNLWFIGPYQVMRYATCASMPAPVLTAARQTLTVGESVTLQAAGCQSALWSWTSEAETVTNRLVQGTGQLVVSPAVTTTYQSRCYDDGCSGAVASLRITVLPKLILGQVNRPLVCPGDSLTVGYKVLGNVMTGNQFSLIMKQGGETTLPATVRGTTLTGQLPATLPPGRYVVYAQTTQPLVRSQDSVLVMVAALPTAELSASKPTFLLGDSTRIAVALTGAAPWRFTRWDAGRIEAATSPYTAYVKALQPTSYRFTVTALSDANCSVGITNNTITVSALPLGTEPAANASIVVYPNPTNGRLSVEMNRGVLLSSWTLTDALGRLAGHRQPPAPVHRDEWDMGALPMGVYVLTVVTNEGEQLNFKVVKQ